VSQSQCARSPSSFVRSRGRQQLTCQSCRAVRRGAPESQSTRTAGYTLLRCWFTGSQGTTSFGQDLDTPVSLFDKCVSTGVSCASSRHFNGGGCFRHSIKNAAMKSQPRVPVSKLGSELMQAECQVWASNTPYSFWV